MQVQRIDGMFHSFNYIKSSAEIVRKMSDKIDALEAKVKERKQRVASIREDNHITDAVYIDLLEQARDALKKNDGRQFYSVTNAISKGDSRGVVQEEEVRIGAGVVNFLFTETDFIKNEEAQALRLKLICRNLVDLPTEEGVLKGHTLSEEELKYLEF